MKTHSLIGYAILLMTLFLQAASASASPKEAAASVLFQRYETVFHTMPVLLRDVNTDTLGFASEPFGYLLYALAHKNEQFRKVLLENGEGILLGTKDYLPPEGLGRVVSTRCYIVLLSDRNSIDVSQFFGEADRLKTANGFQVWTWSEDLGEFGDSKVRRSSLYVAQVAKTFVLFSNSLSELESVSGVLASSSNQEIVLPGREWELVKKHQFWGCRMYRPAHARPAATVFNGLEGVQPEAEALILFVDFKRQKGIIRLISSNPNDSTRRTLRKFIRIPPAKPAGRGQWEFVFPLTGSGRYEDSSWSVMWLFGLGVAV